MAKNFTAVTDAMVNAALDALPTPNTLVFILIEENEASVDVTDGYSDLTQVGSQALTRASLVSVDREVDCGDPLIFTAVGGGLPSAILVLSDLPANTPDPWAVVDINSGSTYDFDTLGDLAIDALIIKFAYQGEP